jgi:uncharacterized protein (DUF1499 family)
MIRRQLYTEVRISRLAILSRRIAGFSVPVVLLAVGMHRWGLVEYEAAFAILLAGLAVALLGLLVAGLAFIVIWREGLRGLDRALMACAIGVLVLGLPAFDLARGAVLPAISDITTDFNDPPPFQAIASARARGANPVAYAGGESVALQRAAYPGVKPLELEASPDEVFNLMLSVVEQQRWRVLDSVPPRGGERDGRIEAVSQSFIMGFRDDISIRVRATADGVKIDMRSASRYGNRDLGSNARRIERFFAQFMDARRKAR